MALRENDDSGTRPPRGRTFAAFDLPPEPYPVPAWVLCRRELLAGLAENDPHRRTTRERPGARASGRTRELESLIERQARIIDRLEGRLSALGRQLGEHWASPDDGTGLARAARRQGSRQRPVPAPDQRSLAS